MANNAMPPVNAPTPVEKVDEAVAKPLVPHGDNPLIRIIGAISDLSDQQPLYVASGAVIGAGLLMRDGRNVQDGTRLLASHLFATALRGMVKQSVDRTRPDAAAERGEYEVGPGERYESDFNSFPSGHAAGAVAFARAASRGHPGLAPVFAGAAVASSAAQVLRSKHYVSDVVAGAAIGLLAEAAIAGLIKLAERR
jgi:membrane-associated phospholipid phosphatase